MRPLSEYDHVVHVDGLLDAAAARMILASTQAIPAGEGLVVDLSGATMVDDVAVAFLAESLTGRLYRLRGLSTHHERLLKYLGLASQTRAAAAGVSECTSLASLEAA